MISLRESIMRIADDMRQGGDLADYAQRLDSLLNDGPKINDVPDWIEYLLIDGSSWDITDLTREVLYRYRRKLADPLLIAMTLESCLAHGLLVRAPGNKIALSRQTMKEIITRGTMGHE